MSNPEALAAISQIQSGMQRLQAAAPELYASLGMPNLATGLNLARSQANSSSTSSTSTTTSSNTSSSATTTTPAAGQGQNADAFRQLMNSMVTGMANQGLSANVPPPEERFQTQLETLANMGFVDRQANIQGIDTPYKSYQYQMLYSIYLFLTLFNHTDYNIFSALIATYGDVNAAIDRLLNSRSAPGGQSS